MQYNNFSFEILKEHNGARTGIIATPHGEIHTPSFIFCATKASIKGVFMPLIRELGVNIILSNTYHLMLQPGADAILKLGGLQKFTGWNGPMLTDSGGFQIFSLGYGGVENEIKGRAKRNSKTLLKISEEGAFFRSYIDGTKHLLTPELSIKTQVKLGADLILVFDECTPFNVDKIYTEEAMNRSHRWYERSISEFTKQRNLYQHRQALYGIVQGGIYNDLREISVDFVNSKPFFGHAIGGSLGQDQRQMYEVVAYTSEKLDKRRPIHLLGIGKVKDIFQLVKSGIDTFDCVHPTRLARHGGALVKKAENEYINLHKSIYKLDAPIEEDCNCYTCNTHSKGYINHLLKASEFLGGQLITLHNISFMAKMMKEIRKSIITGTLEQVEKKYIRD